MANRYFLIKETDKCCVTLDTAYEWFDEVWSQGYVNNVPVENLNKLGDTCWWVFSVDAMSIPPEGSISLDMIIRMIEYQDYKRKKRNRPVMDARSMLKSLTGF